MLDTNTTSVDPDILVAICYCKIATSLDFGITFPRTRCIGYNVLEQDFFVLPRTVN
jgi:hypothetical protein